MKKKMFATLLTFVLMFSVSGVCFAAESTFTRKFVDSNSKTYVTSAKKDNDGSVADVKVTDIYTSKEGLDIYSKIWVEATNNGNGVLALKNAWTSVAIPTGYRSAGDVVPMYATGFIPFLDCYVSGYWNVH